MPSHDAVSSHSISGTAGDEGPVEITLSEDATLAGVLAHGLVRPLLDGVSLDDTLTSQPSVLMAEGVKMVLALSSNTRDRKTIAETVSLAEEIRLAFSAAVTDGVTLSASEILGLGVLLSDALSLSSDLTTALKARALAADILALADTLSGGIGKTIAETGTLSATFLERARLYEDLLETGAMDDTASNTARISILIDESGSVDDSLQNNIRAAVAMDEALAAAVTLPAEGTFTGWVMNTETRAVTQYTNYDFTSFAEAGGSYYGTREDGLYLLSGADDAGSDIAWKMATGIADIGGGFMSRVPECYMGFRSDGSILLKTITGETVERWYKLRPSRNGIHEGRIKLGKGVKSRYWQFELEGISGSDLELDTIEFYPVILTRKV